MAGDEKYQNWTVFTKIEMNNEWNIIFVQNNHLGIQHTYNSDFPIGRSTSNHSFDIALSYVLHILKSPPWDEFSV